MYSLQLIIYMLEIMFLKNDQYESKLDYQFEMEKKLVVIYASAPFSLN